MQKITQWQKTQVCWDTCLCKETLGNMSWSHTVRHEPENTQSWEFKWECYPNCQCMYMHPFDSHLAMGIWHNLCNHIVTCLSPAESFCLRKVRYKNRNTFLHSSKRMYLWHKGHTLNSHNSHLNTCFMFGGEPCLVPEFLSYGSPMGLKGSGAPCFQSQILQCQKLFPGTNNRF